MHSTSQTQRTLIPINIETLAGTSFELLVSPYEQIQLIKRKIERREGIPSSHQHLIWKTTELDDESCLNDYNIESGTTLKLVLAMRGGPVNTKRVPIEDSFIRDMSEYIENSRDDYDLSTNKNVTFLVLRDGDQFNFFQVIDRGDGTLSPLSGSISATSMYNTHDILPVETERNLDEKRQADNRKTKERMESIRSKLKTHPTKDILRPLSSSKTIKSNLISSSDTSQIKSHHPLSYSYSGNLFNTYSLLSTKTPLLHEEDSEDDDDDDETDDDDDDEQQQPPKCSYQPVFTSRSYSPSIFRQKTRQQQQPAKSSFRQESTILVDYHSPTDNSSNEINQIDDVQPKPVLPVKKSSLPLIKNSQPPPPPTTITTKDTFNEHLMLNKRIDLLKNQSKNPSVPPSPVLKRQDSKPVATPMTASSSSILPIDNTKVTIETIGSKTVSALLRQNATIEPVDTSRGVGKHLVSLLTTASSTSYKQSTRESVLEERYKLDSKLTNSWSTPKVSNPSIVSSSLQSTTATIYNPNKLPPVIVNRKSTTKCFLCKKKTGLATTYQCRCGSSFCSEHRYPEAHACAFDYKAEGKRLIERNNPLITAPKLPKI